MVAREPGFIVGLAEFEGGAVDFRGGFSFGDEIDKSLFDLFGAQ